MTTPVYKPAPFDPNAALRQFNDYFGQLKHVYGDAGLRQMGFGPRDLAAMQASLRKLQMDPNATPEQHQQAFQQARDALAQRITTPAAAPQSVGQPVREVRPTMPSMPVVPQSVGQPVREVRPTMPSMPVVPQLPMPVVPQSVGQPVREVRPTMPSMPVVPQLPMPVVPQLPMPVSKHVDPEGPPPPADIVIERMPPDMPPVSNFIAGMNASTQAPGGAGMPYNPVNTTRAEDFKPGSGASVGDVLGSLKNLQLPPQPAQPSMSGAASPFDPNAALRTLNSEFGQLRDKYGVDALRAAGFTPRTLAEMQGSLRNLQLNPNATPEQHQSALGDAMARLRGYNFGTTPQPATPQPIIPQRETPEVPVGQPMPVPPQPMPVPPQPMPAQPQGYYRGGFAVRR